MSGMRRSHNRREISPHRVEALLRHEFSREIEAQRDKVPDWRSIEIMARLDRRARTRSWPSNPAEWSRALALGIVSTVVALWWNDAAAGLKSLLLLESVGIPWAADLGLVGALLGITIGWTRGLGHCA